MYANPRHPYTKALLSAAPDVGQAAIGGRRERIRLVGDVPSPINPPSGCHFRTRCWKAQEVCATTEPLLRKVDVTIGTRPGAAAPAQGATAADSSSAVATTVATPDDLVACHFPEP